MVTNGMVNLQCGLICLKEKTQINRDNTQENKNRVDYDYKVRDKDMLLNDTA